MDHSDIFIKLHSLQSTDEFFSHFWEGCFFMFDVDQLDHLDIKGNGDDVINTKRLVIICPMVLPSGTNQD